jgi:hypothetical protein
VINAIKGIQMQDSMVTTPEPKIGTSVDMHFQVQYPAPPVTTVTSSKGVLFLAGKDK